MHPADDIIYQCAVATSLKTSNQEIEPATSMNYHEIMKVQTTSHEFLHKCFQFHTNKNVNKNG